MNKVMFLVSAAVAATMLVSCNKENQFEATSTVDETQSVTTRAYGSKAPKIVSYVEVNDVNPLNAGDYLMPDGSTFVDIVELFAANIHKDDDGNPTLYLNDKLTPILEDGAAETYVAPLQAKGIMVLLTVLGDWQGIGVANMTDTQAEQFATILAYAVVRYGLDGIGFDDEYANYSGSLVSGSFGNIISKLRSKLASGKLITVFSYGNTSQINSTAGALVDYAYTDFATWNSTIGISGVSKSGWAPSAYNLGNYYWSSTLNTITSKAQEAKNGGYGAIMTFNLRPTSERSPLPVFQAISDVLGTGTISCSNGNRSRDITPEPDGFTIDYAMAAE